MDVNEGSQVAAMIDEAGSREQLFQLFVGGAENRIGFVMPIRETCLTDSLAA